MGVLHSIIHPIVVWYMDTIIRQNSMPSEDDVDSHRFKGTIILIRNVGVLLLINSILIFGIGGFVGSFWSGVSFQQARSAPWFGGINGFFVSVVAIASESLFRIRQTFGMSLSAIPVIIAALVLNGYAVSFWNTVDGCSQVTNPANYSIIASEVPGAKLGPWPKLTLNGIAVYGNSGRFKYDSLYCLKTLYGNNVTVDDDNYQSNQNSCFCFSSTNQLCVAGQIGPIPAAGGLNCGAVFNQFDNSVNTAEVLLVIEAFLCILLVWYAGAIMYAPQTPLSKKAGNDQI